MDTVPNNLIYGVDDKPPWGTRLLLGSQHLIIGLSYSIFAVLVARQIGATMEQVEVVTTMAILSSAVGVFLQSLHNGPVGSGYLIAHMCSIIYIPASIAAGKAGGLALISGMTLVAGLFEAFLSQMMRFLKKIVTPAVTGVIVTMVGFSLVKDAVTKFVGLGLHDHVVQGTEVLVAAGTLAALLFCSVWGTGRVRLFGLLISVAGGYLAAQALGVVSAADMQHIRNSPLLAFPKLDHYGWSFDAQMLPAFLAAGLAAALKSSGLVVTSQKINDPNWRHPNMENVGKGVLADAAGTFSAGLLGSIGTNLSPTSVGLTVASGASSRVIGKVTAVMLAATVCCPAFVALVSLLPNPVMGGVLIYAVCIISGSGLQLILSRAMDMRKTFLVGLSLLAGLSVEVAPTLYQQMPVWTRVLFDSPITICAITAVGLSLLFRIGLSRHAKVALSSGPANLDEARRFIEQVAADWHMTRDVLSRATSAVTSWLNSPAAATLPEGSVGMKTMFDGIDLSIRFQCFKRDDMERKQRFSNVEPGSCVISVQTICKTLFDPFVDRLKIREEDEYVWVTLFFDA